MTRLEQQQPGVYSPLTLTTTFLITSHQWLDLRGQPPQPQLQLLPPLSMLTTMILVRMKWR